MNNQTYSPLLLKKTSTTALLLPSAALLSLAPAASAAPFPVLHTTSPKTSATLLSLALLLSTAAHAPAPPALTEGPRRTKLSDFLPPPPNTPLRPRVVAAAEAASDFMRSNSAFERGDNSATTRARLSSVGVRSGWSTSVPPATGTDCESPEDDPQDACETGTADDGVVSEPDITDVVEVNYGAELATLDCSPESQDVNNLDAPEIVIMRGNLSGVLDLSPAFLEKKPLGSITGDFNGHGQPETAMAGQHVRGRFDGVFRLPFRHNGKASYLLDDETIVPVSPGEFILGSAMVRLELMFSDGLTKTQGAKTNAKAK